MLFLIAACSGQGGRGCGAKAAPTLEDGGSGISWSSPGPQDPAGRLEAARKALAARPDDADTQATFERAWLDSEFLALGEALKGHKGAAAPLELGDCAGAPTKDCIGTRIGRRYDSTWTRAEVRDAAFLLLIFHARHDEDAEAGNELVVFRGILRVKQGAPLKLDLVSRGVSKVSDAVGIALGRGAVVPSPADGSIPWGIRFEPLSPKAFGLVASLPDEWVSLYESASGELAAFEGTPRRRGRLFIHREPKLRMAWLSWSDRDGQFEPILEVTKKGSTWHLGETRLRWRSTEEDIGYVARGSQEGRGDPYVPAALEEQYRATEVPSSSEEAEAPDEAWTDEELALPEAVRRHLVACTTREGRELKPGLYEAWCGCGNPCGYRTFVDVNDGRTSDSYWLPLAVDAERERVALSTNGAMPIRIIGMFDQREWMVLRRPAGDAMELSHIVEVTFDGERLHLKYDNRRWQPVEEVVELPHEPPPHAAPHE